VCVVGSKKNGGGDDIICAKNSKGNHQNNLKVLVQSSRAKVFCSWEGSSPMKLLLNRKSGPHQKEGCKTERRGGGLGKTSKKGGRVQAALQAAHAMPAKKGRTYIGKSEIGGKRSMGTLACRMCGKRGGQ